MKVTAMRISTGMILCLVLLLAGRLAAQTTQPVVFELGARAGVPFHSVAALQPTGTQQVLTQQNLERPTVALGPTFGAVLYDRLQVEFGAIYKPVRFDIGLLQLGSCADPQCTRRNPGVTSQQSSRAHLWEFPLTANYFLGRSPIRPYAGGGIVISQDLGGRSDFRFTDQATGNETRLSGPVGGLSQHWPSPVVDVGFRWTTSFLNIQPELRYTRHRPGPHPGFSGVIPRENQLDFLVGFSRSMK